MLFNINLTKKSSGRLKASQILRPFYPPLISALVGWQKQLVKPEKTITAKQVVVTNKFDSNYYSTNTR